MPGSRKNNDRNLLWPRPVKYLTERDNIIFLAVNDQRIFAHGANGQPAHGRRNQNQISRIELFGSCRRNETAEGESRQQRFNIAEACVCETINGKQIVKLPAAVIEYAIAFPDTPEIETHGSIAERMKRFGKRLNNFVVEGSTMKRMRVSNNRVALAGFARIGDDNFDPAGRAVNFNSLVRSCFQMRKRSTMTPSTRCLSIISSTSC